MSLPSLPNDGIPITNKDGKTTKNWYFFFTQILSNLGSQVTRIIAGTGITISPPSGIGDVTITASGSSGVSQIVAGTNVSISPPGGTGIVTVNAAGSGTVTSVTLSSTGGTVAITGTNPITTSGTINLETTSGPANITPDTHPSSPTVFDDEFESGSSIDLTGARRTGALPWSWTNQNSSTALVTQGSLVLTPIAGGARNTAILTQSLSGVSSPWTFTAKVQSDFLGSGAFAGMVVTGTGGLIVFGISGVNSTTLRWNVQSQTNPTTLSANIVTSPNLVNIWNFTSAGSSDEVYLQISFASPTITFSASVSGAPGTFIVLGTTALATLLVTFSGIGLAADLGGGGSARGVYDWFRRTA